MIFSCLVHKYNKWSMKQDRTLLLTNQNLYNIKDKAIIQRKISIDDIQAISKSTKVKNNEFIVHIRLQYDYHFESEHREQIIDAIKWLFY